MVEFVRYVSAQVRGNPGLSCGEVANEEVRSIRQCTNPGNSDVSYKFFRLFPSVGL